MPKTVPAGLATHIAGESLTITTLLRLIRRDGTEYNWSSHDKELLVDVDNPASPVSPKTYKVESSGYTRTNMSNKGNLSVDNQEIDSNLDRTLGISENDVRAGKWQHTTYEFFTINYNDIAAGVIKEQRGTLGNITLLDESFSLELRSLVQALSQTIVEVTTANCRADLGDARCKVDLEPADWVASTAYSVGDRVSSTTFNARKFIATTAGTSDSSEPTWDTAIGNTTADNTVVWTTEEAFTFEDTVLSVVDQRIFNGSLTGETPDSPLAATNGTFAAGLLTWLTGVNAGISMDIRDWTYDSGLGTGTLAGGPNLDFNDNSPADDTIVRASGSWVTDNFVAGQIITVASSSNNNGDLKVKSVTASTLTLEADQSLTTDLGDVGVAVTADSAVKEIELEESMIFTIAPGDTFKFYVGCDKTGTVCINTFANLVNYRGFRFIKGRNDMIRRPDAPQRS